MSASIEEVLSGLGSIRLTHDWSPDVDAEALFGRVLQVWKGEDLIWAGPLLTKSVSKDGIELSGRSHEYWLGLDEDGPVIEDREFVAGTNKLSNGGFELGPLYWRLGEDTQWVVDGSAPFAGSFAARLTAAPEGDDPLESDESYEAEAGQKYSLDAKVKRFSGSYGILRLRLICEGIYVPQNFLPAFDEWEVFPFGAGLASIVGDTAVIGPNVQPDLISNYDFTEGVDGLEDWTQTEGTWEVTSYGPWGEVAFPDFPGVGGRAGLAQTVAVEPSTRYRVSVFVADFTGTDGNAYLQVNESNGTDTTTTSDRFEPTDGGSNFQVRTVEVSTREDTTQLSIFLVVTDQTTGTWLFTLARIQKIEGNYSEVDGLDSLAVYSGESYEGFFPIAVDPGVNTGTLKIGGVLGSLASSRPGTFIDLGEVSFGNDSALTLVPFNFTCPSGYDFIQPFIRGVDIYGGSVTVSPGVFRNSSTTRQVQETWFDEAWPDWSTLTEAYDATAVEFTVPDGTERIHAVVLAEEGSGGWAVDNVSLWRSSATISTSADVLDVLCRNPETNAYLVTPGSIEDTALPYDLRYRNMTNRTILKQFSRAVMQTREWRISPLNVLDWGTPESLYEDRTDFVLKPSDVFLLDAPVVEQSAENAVQNVKVIGSGPENVGRKKTVLEATATNDPEGKVDYFGNDWTRTRIVTDATVDHIDYAGTRARYEADKSADKRQTVRLRLADTTALAKFNNGDWIYVEKAEAGLFDENNEMNIDGQTVWPARKRSISRTLRLGNGYRAEIRRPDGTTFPLENVQWEHETVAEVEVGDVRPEFVGDPQSGAPGNAFNRFIASSPR